ncbi:uncharacterized protein LOC126573378 [Anopheles aquasalis]|uniref:uncharacterized protein LOC126573378 n=1 Tax=Anopheles aquasalis TaxID=42839 RepID=UPI00215B1D31|nr:uncharacterized protein LOC126573378 [Anopheles aquasalis]
MVEGDALPLPQGNLSYTAEIQMVGSEWWLDSFVKSEVEVRSEIVDPAVRRICRLCRSSRDVWKNCFTSTGQLTIDQERLSILRRLCSVVITFEADRDAVICEFCCHALDEIVAFRSIWLPHSTETEQQRIIPAAINRLKPMVSIPTDAIKQESSVNTVATEVSESVCSPAVLLQKSTIAVQTDAPIIEQVANDRNEAPTDSPAIEEPLAESCAHPNPCAAEDTAGSQIFPGMADINNEPADTSVQPEAPPVPATEERGNLQNDAQQVPICSADDDGMSPIDLTSNDDTPIIDLTCCDMTSGDDNSAVDEEKDRLIRKTLLLVQSKFKVNRLKKPKKRRRENLRNKTC